MSDRITLTIDRITLPAGMMVDRHALEAALQREVAAYLEAGGTLGPAREVRTLRSPDPSPDPRSALPLAEGLARTLVETLRP